MAGRNKKGKLHSIFSNEFDVTFFYKPPAEAGLTRENRYYYIVLSGTIFIKARFIDNSVLIIDSTKSLTTSLTSRYYDMLTNMLKKCESITVLASAIGCCQEFIQSCKAQNIPTVECEDFSEYSHEFYDKFKIYNHSDISLCGYYLLALDEASFNKARENGKKACEQLELTTLEAETVNTDEATVPSVVPARIQDTVMINSEGGITVIQDGVHKFQGRCNTEAPDDLYCLLRPELLPLVDKLREKFDHVSVKPDVGQDIIPDTLVDKAKIIMYPNKDNKDCIMSFVLEYIYGALSSDIYISKISCDNSALMAIVLMINDIHVLTSSESSPTYHFKNIPHFSLVTPALSGNSYVEEEHSDIFSGTDYKII